jgi:uncharacterized membrane protein YhaH (DUF805 family)
VVGRAGTIAFYAKALAVWPLAWFLAKIFALNLFAMIAAYQAFWTRAFDFSGRTTRAGFWYAILSNIIVSIIILLIAAKVSIFELISFLYSVATIVPGIAIAIRRLRDTGKNGAWFLVSLIPFIGGIWLLILCAQPSIPG